MSKLLTSVTPYLCLMLLTVVLLSPLIFKREFWTGLDTYFHMNSVYEDAAQIKTGHFSYFISLFGFERSGRIVNSLYSPIFNYLCGALLLVCHNWINFEFILFLVTMMIGGIEMYSCSRILGSDRTVSTVTAMLYITSRPVLFMWVSNSEFTGLGATVLLPLVVRVSIRIYQRHQINVLSLAIVMAACLQIHLITSLIAVLTLAPVVFLSFVKSSKKREMVKQGLLSFVLAICLSGNILGAIYDVFSTNHLVPTFPKFNLQTTAGNNTVGIRGRSVVNLGYLYTSLIILVIIILIIQRHSITSLDKCFLIENLFFLWISSEYFPWDRLVKIFPQLASIVQFPARFMPMIFILTLLLLARSAAVLILSSRMNEMKGVIWASLLLILILSLPSAFNTIKQNSADWQSPQVVNYWNGHHKYRSFCYQTRSRPIRAALRSSDLVQGVNVIHKITLDYLPTQPYFNIFTYYKLPANQAYIKDFYNQRQYHKHTKNHELLMSWRNHGTASIQIPLVKYQRTDVRLNHHVIYPHESLIGTMNIKPHNGINQISIRYQPSWLFRIMSLISILGWLAVLLSLRKNTSL